MLKLFASQRNSTAVLLRACLPAAVSWHPRNTQILKDWRRSMSDDCFQDKTKPSHTVTLSSGDRFHVMSLISQQADSLLEIVNILGDNGPSFKCTGMYDEAASLVNMVDSTQFSTNPKKSVSFTMNLKGASYYLSLSDGDVVAKALKDVSKLTDRERFVRLIHGPFSMFESVAHRDCFLGSYQDGSLHLINVDDKLFPDPRTLFLMHLKLINRPPK